MDMMVMVMMMAMLVTMIAARAAHGHVEEERREATWEGHDNVQDSLGYYSFSADSVQARHGAFSICEAPSFDEELEQRLQQGPVRPQTRRSTFALVWVDQRSRQLSEAVVCPSACPG